ncbi:hypothetical protein V1506DRAFT_406446 [Lipomyces tetrasporus]
MTVTGLYNAEEFVPETNVFVQPATLGVQITVEVTGPLIFIQRRVFFAAHTRAIDRKFSTTLTPSSTIRGYSSLCFLHQGSSQFFSFVSESSTICSKSKVSCKKIEFTLTVSKRQPHISLAIGDASSNMSCSS